jgi:hypothetical protein
VNIGLVVDGIAEYQSLPLLTDKINHPNTILAPIKADLQPSAPVPQLARVVKLAIQNALGAKKVDRVLVLLDLDRRGPCAARWAQQFQTHLTEIGIALGCEIFCVIKNDRFENWLISDPASLKRLNCFSISSNMIAQVTNAADNRDAVELIGNALRNARVVRPAAYHKTTHARMILAAADPVQMARNSRSFRRFLRLIGNPEYSAQSKRP